MAIESFGSSMKEYGTAGIRGIEEALRKAVVGR